MATSITQMDDPERGKTVLRIEGEMSLDDAELLGKNRAGPTDEKW